MATYLQAWTGGVKAAREREGRPLELAASNQYPKVGLGAGDVLHIVYLEAGRMHSIGRLPVAEIIDRNEAVRRFSEKIWKRNFYAVARAGEGDAFVFDLRVPDEVVRRLRFERSNGEITRLEPDRDGVLNGQALQAIRRLTPASARLLDDLRDLEGTPSAGAKPHRLTKTERDAVEARAMTVASEHYARDGWTVENVSATRPYDLVASKGQRELHVEVKGTTGTAAAVELTRNEVTHARAYRHPVLAVVEGVELDRGSRPDAAAGRLRLFAPWVIDEGALEALTFSYQLPPEIPGTKRDDERVGS
jgi:hypothetical protein